MAINMVDKQYVCRLIGKLIEDEKSAHYEYDKLEEEIKNKPCSQGFMLMIEGIKDDERKHKTLLETMYKMFRCKE
jgi:hypothetical protein